MVPVRDTSHFVWLVIPLLLVVIYIYGEQIAERRFAVAFGGIAFALMDMINEIINAILAHVWSSGPLWLTSGPTALRLLAGLNIEIVFMFAIMGVSVVRLLPKDPSAKILGINNRLVFASVNALLCVVVEVWLNHIGVLLWPWEFWSASFPWLIWLFGYMPFFLVAYWVHDLKSVKTQAKVVGWLSACVCVATLVFVNVGWI